MEAFLINRPRVQKFLGIEPDGIRNVHLWSFCIGARNALAGVGTLVGLWMVDYGDESTGTTVVVISCIYMLLASLFMGLADLLGYWRPRRKHQENSRVVRLASGRTGRDRRLLADSSCLSNRPPGLTRTTADSH